MYSSITDDSVMSKMVDWRLRWLDGMLLIIIDDTIFMNELDADNIPDSWGCFLNVIVGVMERGSDSETAMDQGFTLSIKKINDSTIEFCNHRGGDLAPIYVYGNPNELLPPIFNAIHECCEIMSKYIKMDNLKQQLQIVKNKADDWMKSFN
ncbi:MAG: hypothetical protein ACK5Z2_02980 [Bacteroidota bacterium]|jgi:hypothetical protein